MSNSNCYYNSCSWGCCNRYGTCPEDYSQYSSYWYDSTYRSCYYYYNSIPTTAFIGPIIGGVVGGFFFLVFLIIVIVVCIRRKNALRQAEMVQANQNTMGGQTIVLDNSASYGGQSYSQAPFAQPYVQPNGYSQAPVYGQPIYGQQPAYPPTYPQQQGPIIIRS